MSIPDCLFAYTAPGAGYPEYVNLSVVDGEIKVTVRGPKKPPTDAITVEQPGDTSAMTLPREQAVELYRALLRSLLVTDGA